MNSNVSGSGDEGAEAVKKKSLPFSHINSDFSA